MQIILIVAFFFQKSNYVAKDPELKTPAFMRTCRYGP